MKLTLGEKIKELRKRNGRKQEDLATALGIKNKRFSVGKQTAVIPMWK